MSLFTQSGVSLNHIQKLSSQTLEQTFERALALLESPGWKQGKTFTQESGHKVTTYKLRRGDIVAPAADKAGPHGNASASSSSSSVDRQKLPWHMRSSIHRVDHDLEYAEFRNGLLLNHTTNEKEYIPDLQACSLIKTFRDETPRAEGWQIQYHTPFGTSNREFASLVMTKDLLSSSSSSSTPSDSEIPLRSFAVVQVPILDVPVSKGFVRGKYTSVEHVEEVVDQHGQRSIRWRMATSSSAGGSIPQVATDMALPSQIAHDVPNFIKWAKKKREG